MISKKVNFCCCCCFFEVKPQNVWSKKTFSARMWCRVRSSFFTFLLLVACKVWVCTLLFVSPVVSPGRRPLGRYFLGEATRKTVQVTSWFFFMGYASSINWSDLEVNCFFFTSPLITWYSSSDILLKTTFCKNSPHTQTQTHKHINTHAQAGCVIPLCTN